MSIIILFANSGCINRNILECKLGKVDVEAAELKRINRNILECKLALPNTQALPDTQY